MQVERDTSNLPSIVMNPVEISFEWDSLGKQNWLLNEEEIPKSTFDINEDGSISGTTAIPILTLEKDSLTKYSVINIGNGTAKNIVFTWDDSNTQRLYNYLLSCDNKNADFCTIGEKSDVFDFGKQLVQIDKEKQSSLMYMFSNDKESYSLTFPAQYTLLIEEAITQGYMNNENNPYIYLYIKYQDIQEKTKSDLIIINISRTYFKVNDDGSGKATYKLIPAFPSDVF